MGVAFPLRAACAGVLLAAVSGGAAAGPPERVVSLDYCADQYVLRFVERDRILALSPDAEKPFSYLRGRAAGLPTVAPRAEAVLPLRPGLVVRSYGGGPDAAAFFERAGVPVLQLAAAADLGGVMEATAGAAAALGAPGEGEAVVARMRARLTALPRPGKRPTALYVTPGGATTGPGSLVHEMLRAAGYENFETRPGWRSLPLERLAYGRPDVVVAAFFGEAGAHGGPWSAMRHPVARRLLGEGPAVFLDGAWTACGGWFLLDAVEKLAAARR